MSESVTILYPFKSFKRKVFNVLSIIGYYLGVFHFCKLFVSKNCLMIFVYHKIAVKTTRFVTSAHVEIIKLRLQAKVFSEKYKTVSIGEVLSLYQGNLQIKGWNILLTFDDGYKNNLKAINIFKKYKIKPLLFVTTGFVDTEDLLWPDWVRAFVCFNKSKKIELEKLNNFRVNLANQARYGDIVTILLEKLKDVSDDVKKEVIIEMKQYIDFEALNLDDEIVMSREDLLVWSHSGFGVGAHSVTHPILSRQTLEMQDYEITTSKKFLQDCLKKEVSSFAYPNGKEFDFNDATLELLKKSNYKLAFTTLNGVNTGNEDPYFVKRIGVSFFDNVYTIRFKIVIACLKGKMITRIINNYKQYRFWTASKRMFLKILKPLFSIETLYILECKCDFGFSETLAGNEVQIVKISFEDINILLGEGIINLHKEDIFVKRLRGDSYLGYVIKLTNKTVGFGWIQTKGIYRSSVGYNYEIPADSTVILDLFIFPEQRAVGLCNKMITLLKNEIAAIDRVKNTISLVYKDNIPSLKSFQNNGFYLSEIVTYKKFGAKVTMSKKNV